MSQYALPSYCLSLVEMDPHVVKNLLASTSTTRTTLDDRLFTFVHGREQEKQMATQPDFILEYAHFLKRHFQKEGINNPAVYVESHVALNGRRSKPFIDPTIDLSEIKRGWHKKTFILPFEGTIKGF